MRAALILDQSPREFNIRRAAVPRESPVNRSGGRHAIVIEAARRRRRGRRRSTIPTSNDRRPDFSCSRALRGLDADANDFRARERSFAADAAVVNGNLSTTRAIRLLLRHY
jgi:hypothetical protein